MQRGQQRQRLVLVGGLRDLGRGLQRPAAGEHRHLAQHALLAARSAARSSTASPRAASGGAAARGCRRSAGESGHPGAPRSRPPTASSRAPPPARSPARCRPGAGRSRPAARRCRRRPRSRAARAARDRRTRAPTRRASTDRRIVCRRQRQRAHRIDLFAADAQAFAAGGQDRGVAAGRASSASTSATTPSITCSQLSSTSSVRRSARWSSSRSISGLSPSSRMPSTAAHSGGHALGFLQRRQVDEPHPVGEGLELLLREAQRQARLAAAADAGQRQQPRRRQQAREVGERRLAADEACARVRQVVARALGQRRGGRQQSAKPSPGAPPSTGSRSRAAW